MKRRISARQSVVIVAIAAGVVACGCGGGGRTSGAQGNLLFPTTAEVQPTEPVGLGGFTEIYIKAGGWWLGIRPDGHGGFGMGSDSYYSAGFGPGTFDFDLLVRRLRMEPLFDTPQTECTVSLIKPGWRDVENESVDDRAFVISLFYAAYAAAKVEPPSLVANAWGEHRPTTEPGE